MKTKKNYGFFARAKAFFQGIKTGQPLVEVARQGLKNGNVKPSLLTKYEKRLRSNITSGEALTMLESKRLSSRLEKALVNKIYHEGTPEDAFNVLIKGNVRDSSNSNNLVSKIIDAGRIDLAIELLKTEDWMPWKTDRPSVWDDMNYGFIQDKLTHIIARKGTIEQVMDVLRIKQLSGLAQIKLVAQRFNDIHSTNPEHALLALGYLNELRARRMVYRIIAELGDSAQASAALEKLREDGRESKSESLSLLNNDLKFDELVYQLELQIKIAHAKEKRSLTF